MFSHVVDVNFFIGGWNYKNVSWRIKRSCEN